MKGILAYQEPGKEVFRLKGEWISSRLDLIPVDHFFVSDFSKKQDYYFVENDSFNENEALELSMNDNNSVFASTKEMYLSSLTDFQEEMNSKSVEKAIFSRIHLHEKSDTANLMELFNNLCKRYKEEAFVYLISDPQFGTWIGATPEILIKGDSKKLRTVALAGTKNSASIEWTPKEIREQRIVTDYIKDKLQSFDVTNYTESELKTVKNGEVFHLRKDFDFQLPIEKWGELIKELHPTPAVCGRPLKQAFDLINSEEKHDRHFYTGLIGYKNENELAVYVNLRCMQVLKGYYALYLGGGITNESIPENEWGETVNKSKTLLSVIME